MAEMAVMNTEYAQAKIVIGSYEFLSEEHRIDSITINTGCYDGNVVSIGCAYTATCSIVMRNIEEISIGTKFEIYFLINEKWENFGKFWVNSRPTRSGELMTINAHGALGQSGNEPFWHPDMFYMNYSATIGQLLVGITEVSEMTSLLFDTDKDVSNFLNLYITVPIKEEYFSPHTNLNYAKSHGISKKDFLSGIAILFGGNVTERNGNVYIVPKVPDKTRKRVTFNRDSYTSDFNVSKETYGVQRVDIDYLPTKSISFIDYDAQKTYICQCYSGTERKKRQMFSSQENMQADVKYSTSIECDWIGYSSNALNYNCFTKDDLVYKIGNYNFIGYNENLYPGNIINIQDENGNEIPFYIGEMTLEWDGGFYTSISCNCNIDISKETYSTNSQSGISSSVNIISGMNYQNKTSFADITFSNVKDSTISGSKFIDGSITGSKFADGSITNSKIADSEITGSKIKDSTLTNALFKDGTIEGSKINFSTFKDGVISGTAIDTSTFRDGSISGSSFVDGTIENSKIKDSTLTGAKIEDATIGFEKVDTSFIEDLTADKAYIDNLTARIGDFGFISADYAELKYATIESLEATDGKIDILTAKAITTDNISASVAELGYLSADSAEITYAKIDFANVKGQVVGSSLIKDGAISDAKISNLSANKITGGTIDASKITVTNLNADNITVGTINGQRIGNKSLSLDKLAEEVPTKEYLDSVQANLQGQIDGAIETFTKTEIPTLNNEPASSWTDNETRKKHIGDVCYVLNPSSSADGYCYRFADMGTSDSPSYEWVLIKDSDVTKALQEIIDINGEISGIKEFDTTISSWKTDTDNDLSSLKSRATSLETDMGTKVSSTTFNSLKQTVDENSSNITSLSETVSKKADGSTVTALSNTVNSVKQTTDSNTQSISNLTTEVSKKADGSTVTSLTNRVSTVEQNLDGFKTTVSSTYATKTEFNGLQVGGRNYVKDSQKIVFTPLGADNYDIEIQLYKDVFWKNFVNNYTNGYLTLSFDLMASSELSSDYTSKVWVRTSPYPSFGSFTYPKETTEKKHYVLTNRFSKVKYGTNLFIRFMKKDTITMIMSNVKLEIGNKATDWTPAPEDTEAEIQSVKTIAEQTADKFNWLVKSGTSATNFELTDRVASLLSEKFDIDALTIFKNSAENGTSTVINGGAIDTDSLFAQDITANGTITGATLIGANADIQKGFVGPFAISDSGMNYIGDNYSFAIEKNGIEISDKIGIVFPRSVYIAKDLIQMDNKYCMATIREDYHTEDATHPFSFEVSRFLDGSGGSYTYKQTESTWYTIDGIHTQVLKDRSDGIIEINTSSFLMDVMSLDVSGVINSQRGFECNKTEGFAFLSADSEGGKLQLQGSGNKYEIDVAGGILRFLDATVGNELALLNKNGLYPKKELVMAEGKSIRFESVKSPYRIRGTASTITIGDVYPNGNSGCVYIQGDMLVRTGTFEAPTIKEGGVTLDSKYCYYQEGTGSVSGGASWKAVTVAFPVEYKTKPFVMVVQNCATTTENIWVTEVTTQGIAFQMHVPTSGWTYEYRWMAIGIKK